MVTHVAFLPYREHWGCVAPDLSWGSSCTHSHHTRSSSPDKLKRLCHETSEICLNCIKELDSVLRWKQPAHSKFFSWGIKETISRDFNPSGRSSCATFLKRKTPESSFPNAIKWRGFWDWWTMNIFGRQKHFWSPLKIHIEDLSGKNYISFPL